MAEREARYAWLEERAFGPLDTFEELLSELALETFGWGEETVLISYVEGLTRCAFDHQSLGALVVRDDDWEGHLFDAHVDVRWARDRDGHFVAWSTREVADDAEARRVEATDQRYYLLGEFSDGAKGRQPWSGAAEVAFIEGSLRGRTFTYPVSSTNPPRDRDRAYVEVVEYQATEPDWESFGSDADAIHRALDAPLLVGHRFAGLGVGRDNARRGQRQGQGER